MKPIILTIVGFLLVIPPWTVGQEPPTADPRVDKAGRPNAGGEERAGKFEKKYPSDAAYPELELSRIAFGSCYRPGSRLRKGDPWDVWKVIKAIEPQVMLLLGDNHYADSQTPERIERGYRGLEADRPYMDFREEIPTFAVWDNHDYASKYPGKDFKYAARSEQLFLEHFRVPESDPRQSRVGVYGSWIFGEHPNRVQIIMLDGHRHRDQLPGKNGNFRSDPDPGKTFLGPEQWKWLEKQLAREAEMRVIGSPIQVLSKEHRWRRWDMFPKQRERLLDLVGEASGTTVFLSGDRHRGEISRLATEGRKPVCDVTASGYFHVREAEERNSLRVGKLINQPHFGALEVDWESRTVAMKVLCSREGTVLVEHEESILP